MIYAAFTAMIILGGCDYHPYYDGQKFCVYDVNSDTLFEEDGGDVFITLQYEDDDTFILEFYGGKGQNHTVTVDSEYLDYLYESSAVKTPPFDYEICAAEISLLPKKQGDTSITVRDDDTGESIQVNIHIDNAYHAIQMQYSETSPFDQQTVFAFKYGREDDVLEICTGSIYRLDLEHVVSGKYTFADINGLLYFEMTYPADEDGRPVSGGVETFKRYQVQYDYGDSSNAQYMLWQMNLEDIPLLTKDVGLDWYVNSFRFVDVTGIDEAELELFNPYFYPDDPNQAPEILFDFFVAHDAELIPWPFK